MNSKTLFLIMAILALALTVYGIVTEFPFVDQSKCVGCGDCTRSCPTGAVTLVDGRAQINPDLCINCLFCVRTCTYHAVRRAK